tara:strand:+ start:48 stop:944 length:897 start_codon:yes stop_codon:yes gene_type:complete
MMSLPQFMRQRQAGMTLSTNQSRVLTAIINAYEYENKTQMSTRSIQQATGISHPGALSRALAGLLALGVIERPFGEARGAYTLSLEVAQWPCQVDVQVISEQQLKISRSILGHRMEAISGRYEQRETVVTHLVGFGYDADRVRQAWQAAQAGEDFLAYFISVYTDPKYQLPDPPPPPKPMKQAEFRLTPATADPDHYTSPEEIAAPAKFFYKRTPSGRAECIAALKKMPSVGDVLDDALAEVGDLPRDEWITAISQAIYQRLQSPPGNGNHSTPSDETGAAGLLGPARRPVESEEGEA